MFAEKAKIFQPQISTDSHRLVFVTIRDNLAEGIPSGVVQLFLFWLRLRRLRSLNSSWEMDIEDGRAEDFCVLPKTIVITRSFTAPNSRRGYLEM